jgi:hypothetical protein
VGRALQGRGQVADVDLRAADLVAPRDDIGDPDRRPFSRPRARGATPAKAITPCPQIERLLEHLSVQSSPGGR